MGNFPSDTTVSVARACDLEKWHKNRIFFKASLPTARPVHTLAWISIEKHFHIFRPANRPTLCKPRKNTNGSTPSFRSRSFRHVRESTFLETVKNAFSRVRERPKRVQAIGNFPADTTVSVARAYDLEKWPKNRIFRNSDHRFINFFPITLHIIW